MSGFQDIKLSWRNDEYVIPADQVMGAIVRIEDVVTLGELKNYGDKQTAPLGKLAAAYGTVLRYAGASVKDEEVYLGMFNTADPASMQKSMMTAIVTLMQLMMPPDTFTARSGVLVSEEEHPRGNSEESASRSSKKRSRRRSGRGGSRGRSSGSSHQQSSGG